MTMPETKTITIKPAKGRPMLTWVGKKPLRTATAYPALRLGGGLHSQSDITWRGW